MIICIFFLSSSYLPSFEKKEINFSKNISSPYLLSNKAILHNFFQKLFTESAAGYVLYGSKPLYLNNIQNEINLCIGSEWHKSVTEEELFFDVWKDCHLGSMSKDYFVKIAIPSTDPSALENEFLLINRQAFLDVVDKNILLFQHELGFRVTAEALLGRLLDEKENITSLFKGKIALLGIILGYGALNSICYERGMRIVKPALLEARLPPPYNEKPAQNENDVIAKCAPLKRASSFGFHSMADEVAYLSKSVDHPTGNFAGTSTKIPFSHLNGTEETVNLLNLYQKAQSRIDNLLQTEEFLDDVLKKFDAHLDLFSENHQDSFCDANKDTIQHLVAQSIYEHFLVMSVDGEKVCLNDFIEGMRIADALSNSSKTLYDEGSLDFLDSHYLQLHERPQTKNNLTSTRLFFEKISFDQNAICIEADKLYYKIIKKGSAELLIDTPNKITIHYLISDQDGTLLGGSYGLAKAHTFETQNLIQGVAYGIHGMRVGEIRDIFIHPDFAYGLYSDFGSGKAITIRLELVGMESGIEKVQLTPLIPFDLQKYQGNIFQTTSQLKNLRKKYTGYCGFRTWMHYKKAATFFTFDAILKLIEELHNKTKIIPELNGAERKILREFNYYLYFSNSTSS